MLGSLKVLYDALKCWKIFHHSLYQILGTIPTANGAAKNKAVCL
jgi:hypothetical protein